MIVQWWNGRDLVGIDIPDHVLQPLVNRMLSHRDWDNDLWRVHALVNKTRLDIQEFVDQQALLASPVTAQDHAEAEAILSAAETPTADEVWSRNTT